MFSNPYFACCFAVPKTEEQKRDEICAYQHHLEEISNLPLEKGWQNFPLRFYHGFWFPEPILPGVLSLRRHLNPDPSDIFLVTYPKSGTTWLKAIVFAICCRSSSRSTLSEGGHPLRSRHPQDCSPYLEGLFASSAVPDLAALPAPRQLGTHIPFSVLPESVRDSSSPCRIIYLCREPKDTLVSTYHFVNKMISDRKGTDPFPIENAAELFCKGLTIYGPVWEHQLEYWRESQMRPEKVFFLKYESVKADPEDCVRKLAQFMGMPFSAEEERGGMVAEIVELCSFEKLSELEVNKNGVRGKEMNWGIPSSSFFRKGKVGDWREHLSVELAEKVDAIIEDKLRNTGLSHHVATPVDSSQMK